jgi:peptide methionine sulfoxide reductase msrA/msrB
MRFKKGFTGGFLLAAVILLPGCRGDAGSGAVSDIQHGSDSSRKGTAMTRYSKSGYDLTPLSKQEVDSIAATLTPEQVRITLNAGTEPAFCGVLTNKKEPGIYVSVIGGLPLFRSTSKYDSKSGWPSFYEPFDPDHIVEREDRSHGMVRTEIRDARSGAHLGHVFDDGPQPTGKRYCINSAALRFIPEGEPLPPESRPVEAETAYFAGGCFWGIEDRFANIPGVIDAVSGYQGGDLESPTYERVCSGTTGHAETVEVKFDPARVTYRHLLQAFFEMHNPTTLDRQGPDVGHQYRSAIFTTSDAQKEAAVAMIRELEESDAFGGRPIVTEVEKATPFYPAEEYHQDYNVKHGRSCRL